MINRKKKVFTFKKKERIRKRKDFNKIFVKGERIKNRYFEIILHNENLDYKRIAIIVKKKYGDAHIRNKIKRKIREIYRLNKEKFPPKRDCVVIIKENVNNLSYNELQNKLFNLLANIYGSPSHHEL